YVVEGSVTRSGNRVRINAQLISGPDQRHLWAETYERTESDILSVQDEIARTIANEIHIRLTPQEQARMVSRTVNPEAQAVYLKARFNWMTRETGRLKESIDYFKQAIAKDSGYALAYAGLADSYSVLSERLPKAERLEMQKTSCETAKKALELDDNLAEAHA